jgi:sialate O-acetylesterase
MVLGFLMGYDGPFRLWLNRKPFFTDLGGSPPCLVDKNSSITKLGAGEHDVEVGVDISGGTTSGFFLRFVRHGISVADIRTGNYAQPSCVV